MNFFKHANSKYVSLLGQPKVKVKFFLSSLKLMKSPQTKFHAHTIRESQVIWSRKSQNSSLDQILSVGQTLLAEQFFVSLSIFYWNYDNRY